MSTIIPAIEQEITKYIQDNGDQNLTVAQIIKDKQHLIAKSMTPGQNYKALWVGYLTKVVTNNGLQLKKSRPDWSVLEIIYEKLVQNDGNTRNSNNTSPKSEPSNKTTQSPSSNESDDNNNRNTKKLSIQDTENFKNMFKTLNPKKFWTLSSGTVVEEQMRKFALTCTHEHPCHSMIVDPGDVNWRGYFTDEELVEIEQEGDPKFFELPDEMNEYLNRYKNLKNLDDIWAENSKHNFHPIKEPRMYWLHTSIARVVDVLMKNLHEKYKTEADLMKRIWVLIDCCFDDGGLDGIPGEYVLKATTARVNTDKYIAAVNAMSRKKIGTKTDLLFTTEFLEFGTGEAGEVSDVNSTKTISETSMKIPKTLKDMLFLLANECPSHLRQLKTCGFVISGLNILPIIMDSPKGYVSRINRPSRFFHHPTNAANFAKNMRSIVRIIYNAKIVMDTISTIMDGTEDELEFGSHNDVILPLSFVPEPSKPSKKRKTSSTDSEQPTPSTSTTT